MITRRAAAGVLILVAGLLLSACAGPSGGNHSGRRITFAFRSDDKPASFVQDGKPTGFMIELTQAMAQKMRVTPSYVATDFASMLPSVRNHTYDSAAFGAQVTPARQQVTDFTVPVTFGQAQLISRAQAPMRTVNTARNKSVAVTRGSELIPILRRTAPGVVVKEFPNIASSANALTAGQVDGLFTGSATTLDLLAKHPDFTASQSVGSGPTALPVAKDRPELRKQLDDALSAVIADGTYTALFDKWNPPNVLIPDEMLAHYPGLAQRSRHAGPATTPSAVPGARTETGPGRFWHTFFDLGLIRATLPSLLREGLLNTLLLAALASLIGLVAGVFLAAGLMSRLRLVRLPCRIYVDVLRGLPHILSIYLIGQGLPLAGLTVFGGWTYGYAALAIGLMEGSYLAEIFRSGFQSVDRGIVEAARSLGMSGRATMRLIVAPIGIRRVLPALAGQFILVIKSTALVYLLGLAAGQREMFAIAQDSSVNNAALSPLVAAGLVYLALTVPLTYAVNAWDRRLREGRPAPRSARPVPAEEAVV